MATVSADIGSSIALEGLPRTIERVRAMVPPDLARNERLPHQKIVFSTAWANVEPYDAFHSMRIEMASVRVNPEFFRRIAVNSLKSHPDGIGGRCSMCGFAAKASAVPPYVL
jgi:hypothetical protein